MAAVNLSFMVICQFELPIWSAELCAYFTYFSALALVSMLLVPLSEALKRRHRQPVVVTTQVMFVRVPCANQTPTFVPN